MAIDALQRNPSDYGLPSLRRLIESCERIGESAQCRDLLGGSINYVPAEGQRQFSRAVAKCPADCGRRALLLSHMYYGGAIGLRPRDTHYWFETLPHCALDRPFADQTRSASVSGGTIPIRRMLAHDMGVFPATS